ncbi:YbaB/EbfC family nucleoid-associated protein [Saccharomonospora azurea]|uniref:YbaB/EbfC DNA-binding family protein n=1 Tax=Saccharomonospora azurea NA-128 TaxID=882081 RepID=H8GB50_9PSEU|nr:YbaB/EbfC family nucleoid-associated protein [Saccharomonospora azurea]EHK87276.1 hypothetical protein SZMC14600_11218 [Saccharomonospora azurea SZMC 14600]EHY90673.1 hypothetical protein SacazDRAFT_03813 [Saccharomonospora azurea NA-128]
MSGYAAQLMRRIEALDTAAADNRRRAEAYQRTEEELKDVSASVTSPDGVVTVVAGPGGVISSVTFSESVHDLSPASLSTTVQQTIAAAVAAVARRQADVVRRGLGSSELLDRVTESDETLFGDRRPTASAEDLAPATSGARNADDEVFFEEFDLFESSDR